MIENTHPKTRNYQTLLLLLFVCLDLGFSFLQHYHVPIDGDMAESVMPSAQIQEVFDDPYGLSVFKTHIPHTNPNRYFAHATLNSYFRTAPFFLQKFVDPITSVYLASALFKIVLQILLLYVFSFYVKGKLRLFNKGVLLSIALITPWFQTHGSKHYMGIIDDATSYVFFYALPLLLMMVFYLPFYLSIGSDKSGFKSIVVMLLWPLLALYLALSGPLNPGIILVVNLLIGVRYVLKCVTKKALSDLYKISYEKFILVLITLLSVYSLYIGTFNSSNLIHTIPLSERYEKIPEGILHLSRSIFGLPALLFLIVINLVVIRKYWREQEEAKRILSLFNWLGVFALVYVLLLPIGGYRDYRPYVVRYDTIMPITILLIVMYAKSTIYILSNSKNQFKVKYVIVVCLLSLAATLKDKPQFDFNECEISALNEIRNSPDSVVLLSQDCTVLSWNKQVRADDSKLNADLLRFWNIIDREKLYYQK